MILVDEKVKLNKIKMKSTDNSKVLFNQITAVETRFQIKTHQIKEKEKIAVILSQALMKYKTVLTNKQRLKADQGVNVTVKDLEEVMNQHYCLISGCNEDDDDEITLYAGRNNKYNGKSKQNKKKRFKGNCRDYRKYGHMVKDCWANERNASKRPQ